MFYPFFSFVNCLLRAAVSSWFSLVSQFALHQLEFAIPLSFELSFRELKKKKKKNRQLCSIRVINIRTENVTLEFLSFLIERKRIKGLMSNKPNVWFDALFHLEAFRGKKGMKIKGL